MKRVLLIVFFAATCASDGAEDSALQPSVLLDLGKGLLGLDGSGAYLHSGKNDRSGDYGWKDGQGQGYGSRGLDGYRGRGYDERGNIIGYRGYDGNEGEEKRGEEYYRIGYEEPSYRPRGRQYDERRNRNDDRRDGKNEEYKDSDDNRDRKNDDYKDSDDRRDRKDDDYKDLDRKLEYRGYDNRNYGDFESGFPIPELVGRQGLGLQRRDKFSDGYRYPLTFYLLKPIGYRDSIKDFDFEPLKY